MMVPFIAFFVLLVAGLWLGELDAKRALIFFGIWAAGLVAFGVLGLGRTLYVAVEVLLDCVLILKIFGGDIRIR